MRHTFAALAILLSVASSVQAADLSLASGVIVAPGDSAPLPVFLTSAAPAGGISVTLSSNDTSKVTIRPNYIYIAEGATAPSSQPRVTGVNFGSASITAAAHVLAHAT